MNASTLLVLLLAKRKATRSFLGWPAGSSRPDVPGFRTWGGIYGFAFAVFVAVVAALTLFTRAFA